MFKVFLSRYRSLITLIWCIGVFLFFKLVFNFQFKNGSSIVFLILILVVPVSLQLQYRVTRTKTKRLKKAHQGTFFGQIKYDFLAKEMNHFLLNPLCLLNKSTKVTEKEDAIEIVTGSDTYLTITFLSKLCKIEIEKTQIVYNLYYERVVLDIGNYDQKGFKFYATENIYKAILGIIRNLKRERLFYQETRQKDKVLSVQLLDRTQGDILYEKKVRRKNIFSGETFIHEKRIII